MNRFSIHLVLAFVVLLCAGGGYVFLFQETINLRTSAGALVANMAAYERNDSANDRERRAQLVESEARVAARFVPPEDVVTFLELLESTGEAYGAEVRVVSVADAVEGRIDIALSITGSFTAVLRTISAFEHAPFAVATKSLSLDAAGGEGWAAAYTMSVATPRTP